MKPKLVQTQSAVAAALNVSKQTVSDWKAAGCSHLQQAPFDVQKVDVWQKQNINPNKANRVLSEDVIELAIRKQEAETRIKELTAENLEFHNAIDKGELVLAADWERTLNLQAEAFRRELTNVEHQADRLLGLKTRDEIAAMLRTIINETLAKLHKGES